MIKIETLAKDSWNPIAISLRSAGQEDEKPHCSLVLYAFRKRIEINLPNIIKIKQITKKFTTPDGSEKQYIEYIRREYGFSLSDGFLSVFFGDQTHDSSTTQSWSYFLPWTQWRHVRHSYYDLDGDFLFDAKPKFDYYFEKEKIPYKCFNFYDFDGEEIQARTWIEERQWERGEKPFKWLSIFYKPKIRRSLDIEFNKEVGRRKGSWKGGTLGHGIEMLDRNESHQVAFMRYCAANNLTFISVISNFDKPVYNQPEAEAGQDQTAKVA